MSGKPGTCKSTTVRVLAKETGVVLTEWNDTYGQVQTWKNRDEDPLLDGAYGGREEFPVAYSSQIDQFERFLHSGSYSGLSISSAGTGGSGSSSSSSSSGRRRRRRRRGEYRISNT